MTAPRASRRTAAVVGALLVAVSLVACGGSSSSPQATLHAFLSDWSRRDWPAMKRLVADPPADFASANARALAALGVSSPRFTVLRLRQSGATQTAHVSERFVLPGIGVWNPRSTIRLVQRSGRWLIRWSPAVIDPSLRAGDRLSLRADWPPRAAILGAAGTPLTVEHRVVTVGVVGRRIKRPAAVTADLLAAGADRAEVSQALALAEVHPDYFEPVFQVPQARFEQLKAQPGPGNVYAAPGTQFELAGTRRALTQQLSAHVVGTVAAITAQELAALGRPYDATSAVGQTGLEQAYERTLAGIPTRRIEVLDAGGGVVSTLAAFAGRPGQPVLTSVDPTVQRAAESALAPLRHNAALVAMRASTGQILAAVSDPVGDAYDQALEGEYPPGSTFKVLTSTALIEAGLSPRSPASCPPSVTIDGEVFHNAEGDQPVQTFAQAFAESCNTAFILAATAHLTAAGLRAAADLYGANRTPRPGLPAFLASVPAPSGRAALAATAIGQGGVVFSPLGLATVAAAIDSGQVRAPRLVTGSPASAVAPAPLPAAVSSGLRPMMALVATSGTAAGTGLPSGTHVKTGTAQYGSSTALRTDAWLMGYDGDLAFALVVQDSGGVNGGPLDGPIVARFLGALKATGT